MKERSYYTSLWKDFDARKRLVLVSGPRQSGKTTLAKTMLASEPASLYFNYDAAQDKRTLADDPAFFEKVDRRRGEIPLIVLDEIHKYRDWKNYLKGTYDTFSDRYRFLVTGSGRLDLYQTRGDSLAGRYWQFHLFPFTLGELFARGIEPNRAHGWTEIPDERPEAEEQWGVLSRCSGFPEPFLSGEARIYRRWAASYHRQVVREDIRDAYVVKQIDAMDTLYTLLPTRVGSNFSASACAGILKVSHSTVSAWVDVFRGFDLIFSLRPYHRKVSRSLVKEPKLYLYDVVRVEDEAARFENMVAVELKRATVNWSDYGAGDYQLWYLRTKEKREVDFLVTQDGAPLFIVEAKSAETEVAPALRYFQDSLGVPAIQLVNRPGVGRQIRNGPQTILVVSAARWLAGLG